MRCEFGQCENCMLNSFYLRGLLIPLTIKLIFCTNLTKSYKTIGIFNLKRTSTFNLWCAFSRTGIVAFLTVTHFNICSYTFIFITRQMKIIYSQKKHSTLNGNPSLLRWWWWWWFYEKQPPKTTNDILSLFPLNLIKKEHSLSLLIPSSLIGVNTTDVLSPR